MQLLKRYLIDERSRIMANNLRVQMLGRRDGIPAEVLEELDTTIKMSRENSGMWLNLAINYGGRAGARRRDAGDRKRGQRGRIDGAAITEQTVSDHLYTAGVPDPDLLIGPPASCGISNSCSGS